MDNEIKWKLKFNNFEKAFKKLSSIVQIGTLNELEKLALIQAFEYTFELAWKTMKAYLTMNGFEVASPRETIRRSFEAKYIVDCDIWLESIDIRNLSSHAYDDRILEDTAAFIVNRFYPIAERFFTDFCKKLEES